MSRPAITSREASAPATSITSRMPSAWARDTRPRSVQFVSTLVTISIRRVYPVIYDFNDSPPYVGRGPPLQLLLQHRTELLATEPTRMSSFAHNPANQARPSRAPPALLCAAAAVVAQSTRSGSAAERGSRRRLRDRGAEGRPTPSGALRRHPSATVQIDRVVAIVNGDLILESDVDEERRFAAFQPYSNSHRRVFARRTPSTA